MYIVTRNNWLWGGPNSIRNDKMRSYWEHIGNKKIQPSPRRKKKTWPTGQGAFHRSSKVLKCIYIYNSRWGWWTKYFRFNTMDHIWRSQILQQWFLPGNNPRPTQHACVEDRWNHHPKKTPLLGDRLKQSRGWVFLRERLYLVQYRIYNRIWYLFPLFLCNISWSRGLVYTLPWGQFHH